MKSFLVVFLSLIPLLVSGRAEARSLIERLDHMIWGHSRELDPAFDAYDGGKFEEAFKAFQTYASGQSNQVANFNAGVAAYRAGHSEDALKFWQRAGTGPGLEPLLKAKALHNTALIQIEKKELASARDSLKEALAFDNDNKPIRENLEWVEQQLKQNPDQNKPKDDQKQDSKQADDKDKQDQENKDNKDKKDQQKQADNKQDDSKKDQQQDSKSGDKKDQDKNKNDSKGQAQKSAEEKQKEKEKEKEKEDQAKKDQQASAGQSKEEKAKDKEKKPSEASAGKDKQNNDKEKKPEDQKAMTAEQKAAEEKNKASGQAILTPAELKSQEAERLLRTIDDKIGRYPLTDTDATGKRGIDGKNW